MPEWKHQTLTVLGDPAVGVRNAEEAIENILSK